MARTVTLKATRLHPTRDEGETYEELGGQAMLDLYKGHARGYKPPRTEPELIKNEPPRKKRRYKRRDMRAE